MYKNNVGFLRESSDWKKENLLNNLDNIIAERDYFENSAMLPRIEQGSPA